MIDYIDSHTNRDSPNLAKSVQKDILLIALLKNLFDTTSTSNETASKVIKMLVDENVIDKNIFDQSYLKISQQVLDELKKMCNSEKSDLNNFSIINEIGSGAFSTVFSAKNNIDGKNYAIKKICSENPNVMLALENDSISENSQIAKKNFENELQICPDLYHPNIVRYYGSWKNFDIISKETYLYSQFELFDYNLTEYAKKFNCNDLNIFVQIAKGLSYLHSKKIIHCDLKPDNVLISIKNDSIRVAINDFGSSKYLNNLPAFSANEQLGTSLYEAPESKEKCIYSYESDIYSFGIIMYEITCKFKTNMERINMLQKLDLSKIQNIKLREIIKKCTCKNSSQRPDIKNVARRLNKLSQGRN